MSKRLKQYENIHEDEIEDLTRWLPGATLHKATEARIRSLWKRTDPLDDRIPYMRSHLSNVMEEFGYEPRTIRYGILSDFSTRLRVKGPAEHFSTPDIQQPKNPSAKLSVDGIITAINYKEAEFHLTPVSRDEPSEPIVVHYAQIEQLDENPYAIVTPLVTFGMPGR